MKQVSAIKIDAFERISSFVDFNSLANISDRLSSTDDIAWRTSVFVDILHRTDRTERIKSLSEDLSKATKRLTPSEYKKK